MELTEAYKIYLVNTENRVNPKLNRVYQNFYVNQNFLKGGEVK
jgi:hypothetical protein